MTDLASGLLLTWDERLAVGHDLIDADHHGMIDLMNAVAEAWQATDKRLAMASFDLLHDLSSAHFQREEVIVGEIQDEQHLRDHAHEHRSRLHQLGLLYTRLASLPAGTGYFAFTNDLAEWFLKQSIGHDAATKAYFARAG